MADLTKKLTEIADEERRLEERRAKVIKEQRNLVSWLAEKAGLLTVPEEILIGAFTEISEAVVRKDTRIENWRIRGQAILTTPKKRGRKPKVSRSDYPEKIDNLQT